MCMWLVCIMERFSRLKFTVFFFYRLYLPIFEEKRKHLRTVRASSKPVSCGVRLLPFVLKDNVDKHVESLFLSMDWEVSGVDEKVWVSELIIKSVINHRRVHASITQKILTHFPLLNQIDYSLPNSLDSCYSLENYF